MTDTTTIDDVAGNTLIIVKPGDVVTVRVASSDQCRALKLPPWSLLLIITHADGTSTIHPGERRVVVSGRQADEN